MTERARRAARSVFWVVFVLFGALLSVVAYRMFGGRTPTALFAQSAWVLWVAAVVLHLGNHRWQYAVAAVGVSLLWFPLLYREIWIGLQFVRFAREGRDIIGDSPMGVPLLMITETVMFGPPTLLLWILLWYQPWRGEPVSAA